MIFDYYTELLKGRVLRPTQFSVILEGSYDLSCLSGSISSLGSCSMAGHVEVWLFTVNGFASVNGKRNVSVGSVSMIQLREITEN